MALILGSPNGGTRRPSWAGTAYGRGVRREVKHLSTCRKGYSVSSGERKRIRPNRLRVIEQMAVAVVDCCRLHKLRLDRKSTRLNSSHT